MDKTTLLGNIITVDNFDVYDDEGIKIFDGSSIVGMLADKSWFRIKRQDMFMDSFYNPNNRSIQYYLNLIKMYNFSLFANGVIFATSLPEDVPYTSLSYGDTTEVNVVAESTKKLTVVGVPNYANASITYTSGSTDVFTVEADSTNDRECIVTAGSETGSATLTATTGTGSNVKTATLTINVVSE